MPRVGNIGKAPPAVGNLLVLGERVGNERELPQVFLEGLGESLRGGLSGLLVRVLQKSEHRLDRQRFRSDLEAQSGDRLVKQPVPGRIGSGRFLVEQLLDAVLELIRLLLADVFEPGAIMTK